jgi:hypothetical protein
MPRSEHMTRGQRELSAFFIVASSTFACAAPRAGGHGTSFPPVVGGFRGAHGEFYGDDEDDGHPVKVRFTWTKLGAGRARWEQAFSVDGRTWERNWVNDVAAVRPGP